MARPARPLSLFDSSMASGGLERVTGTPTVISAAIYFAKLPAREVLEGIVRDQLMSFDTLASRPEDGHCCERTAWRPTAFELARHLLFHEVAGEADLTFFIENNTNEPIAAKDEGPWWEMHAVTTREATREMLFFRIEHACADGIALLQILTRLATTPSGGGLPSVDYQRPPVAQPSCLALACDFLAKMLKYAMLPLGGFDTQLPIHQPKEARQRGIRFSNRRRLVRVPAHPLALVKAIKEAAGAGTTVNDVLYAAFAGALRRHCLAHDATLELDREATVRALVPLAFPRKQSTPLTNDWTFLSVALPVEHSECTERLEAAHQLFTAVKASTEAHAARLAVQINTLSPPALLGAVAQQLFSRVGLAAPCHTAPHRASPCLAVPHRASLCHTAPHRASPCHTVPHRASPFLALARLAPPCLTVPRRASACSIRSSSRMYRGRRSRSASVGMRSSPSRHTSRI